MASSNTCENIYSVTGSDLMAMNREARKAYFIKLLFKNHEEIRKNDEEIKKIEDRTKETRTEVRREVIRESARINRINLFGNELGITLKKHVTGKQLLEENHPEIVEDDKEIRQIKRRTEEIREDNEILRKIIRKIKPQQPSK